MGFWKKIKFAFSNFSSSDIGKVVISTAVMLIHVLGRSAVDELVRKGKDRAERLEREFPDGQHALKKAELGNYLGDLGTSLGLKLSSSLINLLIELIVSSIKAKQIPDVNLIMERENFSFGR